MNKKSLALYLLASSLFLHGCDSMTRKKVNQNKVNSTNEYVSIYSDDNLDHMNSKKKVFEPYEHNLTMKIATTFAYDEFLQIEGPKGYILSVSYGENATGSDGVVYGYVVCTFVNTVPVEAVGYYDMETHKYVYTTPGIVLEETDSLKLTK